MQKFSFLITSYIFHFILLTHHHNCTGSYCCKFIDHWSCFFFTNSLVSFSLSHPCTFFFKFIDPICLFLWSTPISFTINSLIHSCTFYYKFIDPLCFFLDPPPVCFTDLPRAAVEVGSFSSLTLPHWDHCLRSHYLHPTNEQVIVMNKS